MFKYVFFIGWLPGTTTGYDIDHLQIRQVVKLHLKNLVKRASGYYITTTIMIGLQQQDKLTGIEMKPETRPIYAKAAEEILDLPQLGNKKMFNVEECAKADPDVVFLPVSLESYVEELEALDIPVVLLEPETADDFEEAVEIVSRTCAYTNHTILAEALEKWPRAYLDAVVHS